MANGKAVPGLRCTSIFLVALSLSIGWGIRGNFGHEYGAMIAGALAAIAVCLLSGREDWRQRVHYFGMFGALGWAFGGSISYMQVIAYTHSGHLPSQFYGFAGLFVIGFLWGSLGGAGTAFPAVVEQKRLFDYFKPMCWVFGGWLLMGAFAVPFLEHFEQNGMLRHENPLYWFDADWMPALAALAALFAFDLWDRCNETGHAGKPLAAFGVSAFAVSIFHLSSNPWVLVPTFIAAPLLLAYILSEGLTDGEQRPRVMALCGILIALIFCTSHVGWLRLTVAVLGLILYVLWDRQYDKHYRLVVLGAAVALLAAALYWVDIAALRVLGGAIGLCILYLYDRYGEKGHRLLLFAGSGALAGYVFLALLTVVGLAGPFARLFIQYQGDTALFPKEELMINWPQFFLIIPQHLGWIFGLLIAVCFYFVCFGRFRSGSSLFVHMAAGWLIAFLVLPTLGSLLFPSIGGIRMTPPRADDWAGILGVFIGATVYFLRNGLAPVAFASIVSGIIGGLGFSGIQMLKLVMIRPGNPQVVSDPAAIQFWADWQGANWHSWLEQSYGFINGIGIAVAIGLLASRAPRLADDPAKRRRWTEIFAVSFIIFLLTYLNLVKNVRVWTDGPVPNVMKMNPLSIELSTWGWFTVIYALFAVAGIFLMIMHTRRRIALVPSAWLGRGQLFYLVFLWAMAIGNFERALLGFTGGRIITEGVIFANAALATVLILLLPRDREHVAEKATPSFAPLVWRAAIAGVVVAVCAVAAETFVDRVLYGDTPSGHAGIHRRFGPEASWRTHPIRKGEGHR